MSAVEAIPYKNFKDRIRKVKAELAKNRYVEIWDEDKLIYSAEKWKKEA